MQEGYLRLFFIITVISDGRQYPGDTCHAGGLNSIAPIRAGRWNGSLPYGDSITGRSERPIARSASVT